MLICQHMSLFAETRSIGTTMVRIYLRTVAATDQGIPCHKDAVMKVWVMVCCPALQASDTAGAIPMKL